MSRWIWRHRMAFVVSLLAGCQSLDGYKAEYRYARREPTVERIHGEAIADPYRWLEEYSPETDEWISAQRTATEAWLAEIPARSGIAARLERLWNYERYGNPIREGGRYYYFHNTGLQNQSVLYTADTLDAAPRVFLDPNGWSADGTVALAGYVPSEDGKHVAYGIAEAGSDWTTWKVRDIAAGTDLADEVRWVKFSDPSWSKDGAGFFYTRYDPPAPEAALKQETRFPKICYHRLGAKQQEDVLIYERPDQPNWYLWAWVTEDGKYLTITAASGDSTHNALYYVDLAAPERGVVPLVTDWDASYNYAGNDGGTFWVQTDLAAPRGRVVAIEAARPAKEHWRELISESPDALQGVSVIGDRFFASYLRDAYTRVEIRALDGKPLGAVDLPGIGTARGFQGKRKERETFYSFTSFTSPTAIYRYDVDLGRSAVFRAPKVEFDPTAFQAEQVIYTSKDGTRIPMFIVHKKGIARDGANPTLLYGYGGFNISITPDFSIPYVVWMEMGGVYAVANLRGGGEYGEDWHRAGMRLRKQNVFDDFCAAAEWLTANGYTSPKRLAIYGVSNGGLLVGACMTQRPELFGACIPQVGVLDMLRFHKFTVGWGWVSDYGSADDPEEFGALLAYSPYHNVKDGTRYPPTLITTADHDDRVFPAHSFKFAAALQHAAAPSSGPILIRIDSRAGHGAGRPIAKTIAETADKWAFLVRTLDMQVEFPVAGEMARVAR
ncbi:MAG: prolyl oligopeptidase family serine peptidase [Planctomycetes bacterium]|nr:prolyl oligopeptidase family serine peptidase [Planctomycetota bacterium]